MKNKKIEDVLFPDNNTLAKKDDGTYCSMIVDAEIDPVFLEFHNDDCVYVNTKDLEWIYFTKENLMQMRKLINKTNILYKEEYQKKTNK